MSSISAVGSNPAIYQVPSEATQVKQAMKQAATPAPVAAAKAGHDPDHDGDTDGPGLDVNG